MERQRPACEFLRRSGTPADAQPVEVFQGEFELRTTVVRRKQASLGASLGAGDPGLAMMHSIFIFTHLMIALLEAVAVPYTKYLGRAANCLGESLQAKLGDQNQTLSITRPARATALPV